MDKIKELASKPIYKKLTVGMVVAAAAAYMLWKRYK